MAYPFPGMNPFMRKSDGMERHPSTSDHIPGRYISAATEPALFCWRGDTYLHLNKAQPADSKPLPRREHSENQGICCGLCGDR